MIEYLSKYLNNFNLNSIVELIKFIIPVILSVWGIVYIRKSRFYYVEQRNIKLYDDIVKKIKGLSISYNDNQINDNLILFNGVVILKSHSDVKKDEIDKELTIYSPDASAVWKHFEIINSSVDFKPQFSIDKNKIRIEKTLLKANDFISFAGLLDSKNNELIVGHRIYNIIPRSENFNEGNLLLYKISSIFYSILFLGVFSFNLYMRNSERNYNIAIYHSHKLKKEDSILLRFYDYKSEFFINNKLKNIEVEKKTFKEKNDSRIKRIKERKQKEFDSLNNIYHKNPTDKNKVIVLEKLLDNIENNLSSFHNPYDDLEQISNEKLKKLILTNSVNNKLFYKLNDTTKVKYIDTTFHTQKEEKRETDYSRIFISLLGYLLLLLLFVIAAVNIYRYFQLRKLRKIYKQNW